MNFQSKLSTKMERPNFLPSKRNPLVGDWTLPGQGNPLQLPGLVTETPFPLPESYIFRFSLLKRLFILQILSEATRLGF